MDHSAQSDAAIEAFVGQYPANEVVPVGEPFLEYAQEWLPATLVELYRRFGLGWYGSQEIEIVDPARWMPVVMTWFGPQAQTIPFAVTSFGHLYHVDPDGRVQCLDPHNLTNVHVADSMDEFLGRHLLSDESHPVDLRAPHEGATHILGRLEPGELYHFEPLLPLGGVVSPDTLAKGDGVEHSLRTHRAVREQGRS